MGNNSKVNRWAYPIPSNLLPDDDFCAKVLRGLSEGGFGALSAGLLCDGGGGAQPLV